MQVLLLSKLFFVHPNLSCLTSQVHENLDLGIFFAPVQHAGNFFFFSQKCFILKGVHILPSVKISPFQTLVYDKLSKNGNFCLFQIFSSIFILEAILKMLGLGKTYFPNPWNIFDLTIVVVSIIDILVTNIGGADGVGGLTVLRTFRLVKIFVL